MNNVFFVVSHFGSGSSGLVAILNQNPKISVHCSEMMYQHPFNLENLTSLEHKSTHPSMSLYGDHLLLNTDFACEKLYDMCKFIYIMGEPTTAILDKYDEKNAFPYYSFRLRRIYEMAQRTPGAVFLTSDDINPSGFKLIEEYLELEQPLMGRPLKQNQELLELKNESEEECYPNHLALCKLLDLKCCL